MRFARTGTLRGRLLSALAIALTPILIFALIQAVLDANDARNERRDNLLQVSHTAIKQVEQTLVTAETTLGLFASDVSTGKCQQVFERVSAAIPAVINVASYNADGTATCAATRPAGYTMPIERWQAIASSTAKTHRTNAFKSQAGPWVMGVYHKYDDEESAITNGFAVDLDLLGTLASDNNSVPDVEIALSDANGLVFNSQRFETVDASWLQDADAAKAGIMIVAEGPNGRGKLDTAIRPIGTNGLYAIVSRPSPGLFSKFSIAPARTLGLPLVAFSVTLFAAWLAIDWLVLRWMSRLRAMSRAYGAGNYAIKATRFENAPLEMRDLGASLETMAGNISERNTELNNAIDARDAAVKEIHHRVKNNLQIVTSFLNLQSRQIDDIEAKAALSAARHRIDALSIVHQTLYQHERLETVSLKPFLTSLLKHLETALGMEDAGVTLTTDIVDSVRQADDAIPLALFVLEAITNAMKYAFGEDGGNISTRLAKVDTGYLLTITDNGVGMDLDGDTSASGTGLGSRLMKAFSKQLGGSVSYASSKTTGYTVTLNLPGED